MTSAGLVWANLRRRPARAALTLAAIVVAFMLHGLVLGIPEGFRRAALAHGVANQPGVALIAIGIAAIGLLLILVLTSSGMAHAIHGRTAELALLKALGFSHRRIVALLTAETMVPCVAGAALGLVGGKLLFSALAAWLPALAAVPAPIYTTPVVASAALFAVILSIASAAIPARRLARIDVVTLTRSALPAARPTDDVATSTDRAAMRAVAAASSPTGASRASLLPDLRLSMQIAVAARIGLSTLRLRLKGAVLIVASSTAVVFLLLIPLTMAQSIHVALARSGDPARVVIRSSAAVLLDNSRVPDAVAALLADAPGVARSSNGQPLIQSEVFTWPTGLINRSSGKGGHTMLVGVGPLWTQMTPAFRLLSGRLPRPGAHEILAGTLAAEKFSSLDAGTVQLAQQTWRVVGTFRTGGWWDGYLVGHAAEIRPVAPPSAGSAVRVRLSSPQAFDAFRSVVAPRLPASLLLERETDYYTAFWRRVPKHLVYLALILATMISAGAALGTTLVMESALEDRRREIATLRLLGFDSRAVAASVLIEGLVLAVGGALIATALVWWLFDGRTANGAWGVLRLTVDHWLLLIAVGWGAALAVAGTSVLMLRMLRSTALEAIRDLLVAILGTPVPGKSGERSRMGTPILRPTIR